MLKIILKVAIHKLQFRDINSDILYIKIRSRSIPWHKHQWTNTTNKL